MLNRKKILKKKDIKRKDRSLTRYERINAKRFLRKIEKNRAKIKKMGAKRLGLFGSALKGKRKKKSDVDFLVEFKSIDADKFFNLIFLLEKIFNRKVDLMDLRNLRPELKYVKEEAEYVQI